MGATTEVDLIIAVTGHATSGKSVFCELLAEHLYGPVSVINVGNLLRRRLEADGVEVSYKAQIGPFFIEKYGEKAIAAAIEDEIAEKQTIYKNVIIDGIRLISTMDHIKGAYSGKIVHVHLFASRTIVKDRVRKLRSHDERSVFKEYMSAEKRYNHSMRLFAQIADYKMSGDDITKKATEISDVLAAIRNRLRGATAAGHADDFTEI